MISIPLTFDLEFILKIKKKFLNPVSSKYEILFFVIQKLV